MIVAIDVYVAVGYLNTDVNPADVPSRMIWHRSDRDEDVQP